MTQPSNIVCISGAFDPITVGHIHLIKACRHFGRLVVILNSDEWIKRNRGYVISSWDDRKEILLAINGVIEVTHVLDEDNTVCEALERIKPAIFANGGQRIKGNTPERELCEKLDIKLVWGLGGGEEDRYSINVKNALIDIGRFYFNSGLPIKEEGE